MTGPIARSALCQRIDDSGVAVTVASHSLTSDTVDFIGQFGFEAVRRGGEHGAVTPDPHRRPQPGGRAGGS